MSRRNQSRAFQLLEAPPVSAEISATTDLPYRCGQPTMCELFHTLAIFFVAGMTDEASTI
jgi:hypothetical protein